MKTLYESILDTEQDWDIPVVASNIRSRNSSRILDAVKYLHQYVLDTGTERIKYKKQIEDGKCYVCFGEDFGDNPKESRIYIKCGPYTHFICQSMKWERDYYLSLRTISPRYGAKHFQNCDVYIPSKKLIDQYEEFKNIIRRAVDAYDGIKDLETLKEYVK